MKTQVIVDKLTRIIICTAFASGRMHDFRLFKNSNTQILPQIQAKTDTGYLGIKKFHSNTEMSVKRSKYHPLTADAKQYNRTISSQRSTNEHAIGFLKRFKIIAERYRNRRKRYGLRLNLLAGICNFDLSI